MPVQVIPTPTHIVPKCSLSGNKILLAIIFLTLYLTMTTFWGKSPFENIVEKGENAGNQHFLLFPQSFLPNQRESASLQSQWICRLPMLSILTRLNLKGIT